MSVAAIPAIDIGALDGHAGQASICAIWSVRVCPSYGLPGGACMPTMNWPPAVRALVTAIEVFPPNS